MKDKVVVITGVAKGIGKALAEAFEKEGATVCGIDVLANPYYVGDIAMESVLETFSNWVIEKHHKIDYIINNACISKGGLENCSYDDFNYVLRTGVSAPYMLTKLFSNHFQEGASIVNISSTRYLMSQANTESYTAAKGAITALTHALSVTLAHQVRVNAIAPGWIEISVDPQHNKADKAQHPAGRVGRTSDIVNAVMFLCSEKSSFITGEVLHIDGGMTKQMIYHDDDGWKYEKE